MNQVLFVPTDICAEMQHDSYVPITTLTFPPAFGGRLGTLWGQVAWLHTLQGAHSFLPPQSAEVSVAISDGTVSGRAHHGGSHSGHVETT